MSFFIALTSLSSLYPPLLSFSPFFGVRHLRSTSVIFMAVVGPFVFVFFSKILTHFFLLWNGESSAYITFKWVSSVGWFKDAELLEPGNWDFAYISTQGRRN